MMQTHHIPLPQGKLHCQQFGQGPQLWIAFHGFAQEAKVFAALAAALPPEVCLIALDLPWHGQSEWRAPTFTLSDITQAIEYILQQRGQEKYTALGFSFGGRLCMALALTELPRWERLILLAPDGLPRRDLYSQFDRMPLWLKKVWVKCLQYPKWLIGLGRGLHRWRLMDKVGLKFVEQYLQTESQRNRVAGTWLSAAAFPSLARRCRALAAAQHLRVQLITGVQDRVIPAATFAYLPQRIPHLQWVQVEGAAHNLLSAQVVSRWVKEIIE
jgi:pimeloyl-ACP methyl ester carboxylesterase